MKKMKLTNLSANKISRKESQEIRGGGDTGCSCSCYYAEQGGSSVDGNCGANAESGASSLKGEEKCFVEFDLD
jgi:natural product precursor